MGKSTLKGAKKATKYRAREAEKEKPFDVKQSRLNHRIETYEDTMGGDEDRCMFVQRRLSPFVQGTMADEQG